MAQLMRRLDKPIRMFALARTLLNASPVTKEHNHSVGCDAGQAARNRFVQLSKGTQEAGRRIT